MKFEIHFFSPLILAVGSAAEIQVFSQTCKKKKKKRTTNTLCENATVCGFLSLSFVSLFSLFSFCFALYQIWTTRQRISNRKNEEGMKERRRNERRLWCVPKADLAHVASLPINCTFSRTQSAAFVLFCFCQVFIAFLCRLITNDQLLHHHHHHLPKVAKKQTTGQLKCIKNDTISAEHVEMRRRNEWWKSKERKRERKYIKMEKQIKEN